MIWAYLAIAAVSLVILWSMLRGAPYVPSDRNAVASILSFLDPKQGSVVLDLGSGDGRIVMALARTGAEAHGYEFNPLLVLVSRLRIRRAGLSDRAFIHMRNFWNADMSRFSGISVFGAPHIMDKLEKKLRAELRPGARVASHVFRFPTWPHAERAEGGVYLYIQENKRSTLNE